MDERGHGPRKAGLARNAAGEVDREGRLLRVREVTKGMALRPYAR